MEPKSPPPCPNTVTVRRNPHRRARATPSSVVPISLPLSCKKSNIRSFPIEDILSIDVPKTENPIQETSESSPSKESIITENLKVFLRIRPMATHHKAGGSVRNGAQKNVWPQNPNRKKDALKGVKAAGKKKNEICLKVNDSHSVMLCPPQSLQDARRTKTEVYEGFSHVFCAESSQNDVYERMVNPLVEDFLNGKSGMLAALGPSGSGKTHTVFGSAREPGMVSLALRRIFSTTENNGSKCSRTFYLSMFEIYSERGKGEKIMDLSQEGGDLYMQQSNIRGLQEAAIHDAQQAESLIASGMLKRSTAMTNSNIQSSRSQCIINIRRGLDNIDEDAVAQSCGALLTIVDLAGAEREKRTGNQGARLLESNFINNTSMVFGLCLRSLLEHQKNPKKPFQKHFQNSLLTKYLRDFLEGKKRMTLILTAKSGEEDYHDTSNLLRQASPYMNIKFENVEEQPTNVFGNKRRTQTLPKQHKRMKFSSNEVPMDGDAKGGILHQLHKQELTPEQVRDIETNGSSVERPIVIDTEVNENKSLKAKRARENQILLNFSRALWNVLKEYKDKLEATENEVDSLRHTLAVEKERSCALETKLNHMKASCSCRKEEAVAEVPLVEENGSKAKSTNSSLELERHQSIDVDEVNAQVELECFKMNTVHEQVSCSNLYEAEAIDDRQASDTNGISSVEVISTSVGVEDFNEQSCEKADFSRGYVVFDREDLKELEDTNFSTEVAGCDPLDSPVCGSELHRDETCSSVEGDRSQQEEEEVTRSVAVNSDCFSTVCLEEQNNKSADVSSAHVVFDKEDSKGLEEREASGETAGCDTLDSESLSVLEDEISSSLKEDKPQLEEEEEISDPQLGPHENISTSEGCNAIKLPEVETEASLDQPCQSFNAPKPKRRLQPASSILLRNINCLDFDDPSEMPKGRRAEKKMVAADGRERTQGSISLLRLLKENVGR